MPRSASPRRLAAPRPATPGPLHRRAWRHLRKLAAQSVTIMLSVLIALGVNTWWSERKDQVRVRQSLGAMRDEVTANRLALGSIRLFDWHLVASWDSLLVRSPSAPLSIARLPLPLELSNEAYQTAQATGVFALLDYRVASEIGRAYDRQAFATLLSTQMMERLAAPDGQRLHAFRDEVGLLVIEMNRLDSLYARTDSTIASRLVRLGGPVRDEE